MAAAGLTSVAVRGGELAVGQWPYAPAAPCVLAIHGITASHLAWTCVAEELPGARIVAPDLRGRGRSAALPAPYGMEQHATDCLAVLDALGIARAVVVGHSMGAFVAARLAALAPARVAGVVLVDGGLPLAPPPGMTRDEAVAASLGPALARLSMTFPDRGAYRALWRAHPAFRDAWSPAIEAYADYDLVDAGGGLLRPPTPIAAVAADSADLYDAAAAGAAIRALPPHTPLLTAPRGLQDGAPLYTLAQLAPWRPWVDAREVPDCNHYTIVMSPPGAARVAAAVRAAIELSRRGPS